MKINDKLYLEAGEGLIIFDDRWPNGVMSVSITKNSDFLYLKIDKEQAVEIIEHLKTQFEI